MITLAIDASTYVGDVAVLDESRVIAEESVAMKDAHHEHLMPAVAAALGYAKVSVRDLDRVVCGAGPGSFTSLRIAGAIAKGIAAGTGTPLYAVSSPALIVGGAGVGAGTYLVAIDALRGEFYVALYEVVSDGAEQPSIFERERPRLVPVDAVEGVASDFGAKVIGPSAWPGGMQAMPKAAAVAMLLPLLERTGPVDLASWEPSYGRLAEAQVRWERTHKAALPS